MLKKGATAGNHHRPVFKRDKWDCSHCGAPNPDHGNKCGNCDEIIEPPPEELFPAEIILEDF